MCEFFLMVYEERANQWCVWVDEGFCCLVAKSCPTLWDPMNYSTPGFSVLPNLLSFAQIHVH